MTCATWGHGTLDLLHFHVKVAYTWLSPLWVTQFTAWSAWSGVLNEKIIAGPKEQGDIEDSARRRRRKINRRPRKLSRAYEEIVGGNKAGGGGR